MIQAEANITKGPTPGPTTFAHALLSINLFWYMTASDNKPTRYGYWTAPIIKHIITSYMYANHSSVRSPYYVGFKNHSIVDNLRLIMNKLSTKQIILFLCTVQI